MRAPLVAVLAFALLLVPACGGGETARPEPDTVVGTLEKEGEADAAAPKGGDPQAGRQVFLEAQPSCGGCHTFKAAGTEATTGPDLDESLQGDDREHVVESIVNPSAEIEKGFSDIMPKDYGETLSEKQLADLVAFLTDQQG